MTRTRLLSKTSMRLNQFIAQHTGHSRRAADELIKAGRAAVNGQPAEIGRQVDDNDTVTIDNQPLVRKPQLALVLLNKPAGYVCSRTGQGSRTVYDLLPPELHNLKPVGRLDKDSTGLLLMTNDGQLAQQLTHPSYQKLKLYEVQLDKDLSANDLVKITATGVQLDDGPSQLGLERLSRPKRQWVVSLTEGRNRQIRRTFAALGYTVTRLHRTDFGPYSLGRLQSGKYNQVEL